MLFEKLTTTYALTVSMSQFEALLDYESGWNDACNANDTLYAKLANMGVTSDYDGHYSNIITVEVMSEDDTDEFKQEIISIVNDQLQTAETWKNLQNSDKAY